jgi:hypothetical protein
MVESKAVLIQKRENRLVRGDVDEQATMKERRWGRRSEDD